MTRSDSRFILIKLSRFWHEKIGETHLFGDSLAFFTFTIYYLYRSGIHQQKFDTFFGNFNKTFSKLYIPNVNHRLLYHINLLEPFLKMNIHRFFFKNCWTIFFTGGTLCKTTRKHVVKMGGFDFKLGGWRFFGRFFLGRFLAAGGTAALALHWCHCEGA